MTAGRPPRSRLWLLAPAAALYAADAALTLAGQPAAYWAGDHAAAVEANPVAYPLLARGPGPFAAAAVGWFGVLAVVVWKCRQPLALWVAGLVAAAHAFGGACWLARVEPGGMTLAVGYLVAVMGLSASCWRRGRT